MKKLKEFLLSENGMKSVNILFLLSFVFQNEYITLVASLLWLLFLYYSTSHTESKTVKIVYTIFCAAALMFIVFSLMSIIF